MHSGRSDMESRSVPFAGRVIRVTLSNQATAFFKLGHWRSKQASTDTFFRQLSGPFRLSRIVFAEG